MLNIDLHIHTIASGHAYNTILEYIDRANDLGMDMIGISDHGQAVPGSLTNDIYFSELQRLPRQVGKVKILRGIEANILEDGSIDVSERVADKLDYVMAGVHNNLGFNDQGRQKNTEKVLKAIRAKRFAVLTHPYLTSRVDFDIEAVAEAACENGVMLELNISTFEFKHDSVLVDNLKAILGIVSRHGQKIIVNSDAHTIWQLADDEPLARLKESVNVPDELIINNYPDELLAKLNLQI